MARVSVNAFMDDGEQPEMMVLDDGEYALIVGRITLFLNLSQVESMRKCCAATIDDWHYAKLDPRVDNDETYRKLTSP